MGLYSECPIPGKDLGIAEREVAAWQQGEFPVDDVVSNEFLYGGGFPLSQQAGGAGWV